MLEKRPWPIHVTVLHLYEGTGGNEISQWRQAPVICTRSECFPSTKKK
jgi:hypothetical protein